MLQNDEVGELVIAAALHDAKDVTRTLAYLARDRWDEMCKKAPKGGDYMDDTSIIVLHFCSSSAGARDPGPPPMTHSSKASSGDTSTCEWYHCI